MKKMALALLATIAVVLGLAVAPAQAAPYAGSVPTTTDITAINAPGARVTAKVGGRVIARATVKASGAKVTAGAVYLRCATVRNGNIILRVGPSVAYKGGNQRVAGPVLNIARTWGCRLYYVGGQTVFAKSSSDRVAVRVR